MRAHAHSHCCLRVRSTAAFNPDMSWVLVNWVDEDRISVVPAAWVLEPVPIPSDSFPFEGLCYWRNKKNPLDIVLLAISGTYIIKS